jgi:hypothetical protein
MIFSTLPTTSIFFKENGVKRTLLCAIPCLLLGTGVFFVVNHAARARLIVAAVGELPNIPGCPLHESCVRALQEETAIFAPRFPAVYSGGIAGAGAAALMGAAFLLFGMKRREQLKKAMTVALVGILLPVFFGCQVNVDDKSGDKEDPPPDSIVDPTTGVSDAYINPFIGVWSDDADQYWQFRTNGTGGKAAAETGPFPDDFVFVVWSGEGNGDLAKAPASLLILEDSVLGSANPNPPPITVTRYEFAIDEENRVTLTPGGGGGGIIVLDRVSGSPQALSLTNPLIGEWTTKWSTNGSTWGTGINRWSLKYRADGTVKTYHHSAGHQFENGYGLRGNTLVTFGQLRFGGLPATNNAPVLATLTPQIDGTWRVKELQTTLPATGTNLVEWIYTKVDAAQWKEE